MNPKLIWDFQWSFCSPVYGKHLFNKEDTFSCVDIAG